MNKTIKVIDLIDKKYHNLELPKHIKINKLEYFYNEKRKTYNSEYGEQMSFDFTENVLNMEVEIIEEEPEIDIQSLEEIKRHVVDGIAYDYKLTDIGDKVNELIKAIKQLDKKIKEK